MPRTARKISTTNIYHIILRGVNHRIIFEEDSDYQLFLHCLKYYKDSCNYRILAYCLMNNHVHLLMEFPQKNISESMKKIEDKFIWWYNKKYDRCGHLFQERFKSEPVDSEKYLLTVFRYIHQNPMKAHIEDKPGTHRWNSYFAYLYDEPLLVDVGFMSIFFENKDELLDYLASSNDDQCMEYKINSRSDEDAINIIKETTQCESIKQLDSFPPTVISALFSQLTSLGISIRQLSRITGFSRNYISKLINSE